MEIDQTAPPAPKGENGGARRGAGRPKGSKNRRFRRRTQAEVQEIGAGYTAQCLATLIRAQRADDCPWAQKIAASRIVLEFVYGRPAQQVQVAMRGLVEHKAINSEEEYRQLLLGMGVHPSLLPALSPPRLIGGPPGPPPPLPVDADETADGRPDPAS
jgi:hypothetical protein